MKTNLLNNMNMQTKAGAGISRTSFKITKTFISCFSILRILIITITIFNSTKVVAQQNNSTDTVYQKVIKERTAKIVNTLNIENAVQYDRVHEQLMNQYFQLNAIHDNSKATIATIKTNTISKEEIDEAVKNETIKKASLLKQLHQNFITQLSASLTAAQIEKVKDGMTYKVLPTTWNAYMDMLQNLTQEQKDKMYAWLVEARELAMDEGSSDSKHAVFGKYKGKINNYLSAAGYNMKAEGEAWAKRIETAKEAKQIQN
jgi:Protein of unknown function (DUF3826)